MGTGGSSLPLSPQWLYYRRSGGVRFPSCRFSCFRFPIPLTVRPFPERTTAIFPFSVKYTKLSLPPSGVSGHLGSVFLSPSRETHNCIEAKTFPYSVLFRFLRHVLIRFSQIPLRLSPRPISIGQLRTLLLFHLRPINLIVFKGSYYLRYGISYLEASFTLRCFQRLSHPHIATLLCRWRDNRCTIGAFILVLSY